MSTYTKVFPVPTSMVKSFTITHQLELPVRKTCDVPLLTDPCCSFNFNNCGNNEMYFQPVCIAQEPANPDCGETVCPETDLLYFQFSNPDNFNNWGFDPPTAGWVDGTDVFPPDWLAAVSVYKWNCNCDIRELNELAVYADYVQAAYVGGFKNGETYQGLIIDPTTLFDDTTCRIYFRFDFNYGSEIKTFYTEPYERVTCANTTFLKGIYPQTGKGNLDCNGTFYGKVPFVLGTDFYYQNQMRIPAEFVNTKFDIETTEREGWNGKNRNVVSTQLKDIYTLTTRKLPPYIIRHLKTILQAKTKEINGFEYTFNGTVERGNFKTEMWKFKLDFQRLTGCDISEFDCVED